MATDAPNDADSKPAALKKLIDEANLQYSLKNYDDAAEKYSEATEIQAEVNGEMAPENAELLYLYGRCLFKVAVARSDVLGGQVASEKKKPKKAPAPAEEKQSEEIVGALADEKSKDAKQEKTVENKPFFQITGDENWDTDSEDEDAGAADDAAEEEEEDDFATAYEILDVARVLFGKQIEAFDEVKQSSEGKGKGKASIELSPEERHVKERLADTHDLQAEISLEGERFVDAVEDGRASLALRQEIYSKDSELIAEAHFKLSLALEFASVSAIREAQAQEGEAAAKVTEADVDQVLRDEAVTQMELAIESCKARIVNEQKVLEALTGDEAVEKKKRIQEVKEIVADMETRVGLQLTSHHHLLMRHSSTISVPLPFLLHQRWALPVVFRPIRSAVSSLKL
jgi:HAT1-interacting factor 1